MLRISWDEAQEIMNDPHNEEKVDENCCREPVLGDLANEFVFRRDGKLYHFYLREDEYADFIDCTEVKAHEETTTIYIPVNEDEHPGIVTKEDLKKEKA